MDEKLELLLQIESEVIQNLRYVGIIFLSIKYNSMKSPVPYVPNSVETVRNKLRELYVQKK